MQEIYLFIKRFLHAPTEIGALFPSSKRLGNRMTSATFNSSTSLRYLEVGGGSGALTRPIVTHLRPQDWLDIVECDPKFCIELRAQFAHLNNVAVHEISILDFSGSDYDIVFSSLPLNSFRAEMVEAILKKYEKLVKEGGYLSYYEYMGLKKIKQALLFGETASDFQCAQQLKRSFSDKYKQKVDTIWWNLPPARIVHCKMTTSGKFLQN